LNVYKITENAQVYKGNTMVDLFDKN